MTYIIAEPCIDLKDRSCVDVCDATKAVSTPFADGDRPFAEQLVTEAATTAIIRP